MSKQNIYDNDLFYENFEKIRSKEINFNDIIETPIILGMIPELYKKESIRYWMWYGATCTSIFKERGVIRSWN
ncbi:MAG: hypothetical protein ACLSIG_10535 [Subdoligranulum sp.]